MNQSEQPLDDDVDIEAIMGQVRAEVLAKKSARIQKSALAGGVGGRSLPADFYDHLYQAGLAFDVSEVKLQVTPVPVPIIGSLVNRFRQKFHELVLFYINKLAVEQADFNEHLLNAVTILSHEVERLVDLTVEEEG